MLLLFTASSAAGLQRVSPSAVAVGVGGGRGIGGIVPHQAGRRSEDGSSEFKTEAQALANMSSLSGVGAMGMISVGRIVRGVGG